jgi:hypothetical protein
MMNELVAESVLPMLYLDVSSNTQLRILPIGWKEMAGYGCNKE